MERITEPEIKIGIFGWRLPCHAFVFARWDEQSVFLSFLFVSSFTVSVLTIWQSTCIASQPTASFFWHCVTRANPVFSRVSAIQRFFFSWCFIETQYKTTGRQNGEQRGHRCVFERSRFFFLFLSFFFVSSCRESRNRRDHQRFNCAWRYGSSMLMRCSRSIKFLILCTVCI